MKTATAASTVAVVTATAAATTSPWVASTHGHTTTKEAGSSVRLSCRATGGSPVCWGGSEEVYVYVAANSPFDKYSRPLVRRKQSIAHNYYPI